jgi:hypothetical protein
MIAASGNPLDPWVQFESTHLPGHGFDEKKVLIVTRQSVELAVTAKREAR